ncbi:MAG: type II toxin-antitoxin system VapC family toxin [Verrucomicrobia bacterium]|nr:type II toxin-antitoxin system VapC family toxin [Verrucomicrobiota bacterium]
MKKRVYIETTIPSYLAARPCRDLIQMARQQLTHTWWEKSRHQYEMCISEIVLEEISEGDPEAARRRLEFVNGIPLLSLTDKARDITKGIMNSGLLPEKATQDAIHIAVSAVHQVDILLTWNCKHIANAAIMKELEEVVGRFQCDLPILCTPDELLEGIQS